MTNFSKPAKAALPLALIALAASPVHAHMGQDHATSQDKPRSSLEGTYEPADAFEWGPRNTDYSPAFDAQFRAPIQPSGKRLKVEVLADGLTHPWGVAELPGGGMLFTEISGHLHHLKRDGALSAPLEGVPEVYHEGQGGLLDVALGPNFAEDRMVYLTYSKPMGSDGAGGQLSATAAARGRLSDDLTRLEGVEDIWVQNPPSETPKHYGSRILFKDGHAYITTGEHFSKQERDYAQDFDKTYGKVIRVELDGTIPGDNPFADAPAAAGEIWSMGHRNIQGAAFDADGTLYTIEHGPKGGDELNRPEPGRNYGWPIVSYGEQYDDKPIGIGEASREGFEQPLYFWDPVIAPGGMDFHGGTMFSEWNGDLLIGSYVRKGLVRLDIGDDGLVRGEERFLQQLGRVNDVEALADGSIVVLTDKKDGEVIRITSVDGE